ncbi:MAG: hypothetical protein LQ350_003683 [Teloschistes chrysophthalmus]|nr:MAG: hypothetical protein LQ350_003683 [Niorma chrysophthalma]
MSVPEMTPSVYDRAGRLLGNKQGQQCTGMFWGLIEQAFKYSNKSSASIPQDQSLLDFCKIKLKEMNLPETTEKQVLDLCYFWGDYIGGNIETQSLKYFFLEETVDEGNLFLASTYNAVLNRIAKDTYAKANIQLSTKVVSIESPASNPNEDSDDASSSVTVTTAQGTTSTYDEVVVTVPLGYLKRNLSTFHPPLPPHLQSAIHNISYGRLEKVYLTFPTAFWLPTQDQNQNGNQNGDEAPNNQSPFFNQWLAPSYTPDHWPVECLFLSSLPPPCAHPTLLFYMHGPLASHITDLTNSLTPCPHSSSSSSDPNTNTTTSSDPSTTSDKLLTALTTFFRPYYSLLPNYKPNSKNCEPTHAFATDWTHDEFAGWGSYSNFQVPPPSPSPTPINPSSTLSPTSPDPPTDSAPGEVASTEKIELDTSIRTLRHGAPERRVWFAGEATSPFVALGTVTGAWWSGEGVAGRIGALYGCDAEKCGDGVDGVVGEKGGIGEEGEGDKVGTKRGGTGLGV